MPSCNDHELLETVPCGLCGSYEFDIIYEARAQHHSDVDLVQKFRASGDELLIDRLVKCRPCGLYYVNPRLRGDLILSSYTEGEDQTYLSQLAARERTFSGSLVKLERLIGAPGRLLDIGTAAGAFVAAAKARGWMAEGCEPNRWLADWGARHYGIPIRPGSVFDHDYQPASFDVVTLWDVIEHAPDPRALLDRCRAILKPNGVLIVNYPDIGSWVARVLGRRWLFLTTVHLYHFDRTTMTRMLETAGFEVEVVRPHVQRLDLDYILFRASVVNSGFSIARALVRFLGIGRIQLPYWLGQTFVAARRVGEGLTLAVAIAA